MRKKSHKNGSEDFGLIAKKRIYSENTEGGLPWQDKSETLIPVFNFAFF